MPLFNDVRTASRLVLNLLESRRDRRTLAARQPGIERPAPGTIQVAVYFADGPVNLYQVRQWLAPLAELSKVAPVAVISRSPGSALALWDESPVPVLYLRQVVDLEEFVAEQDLRIVFYVNQNSRNFQMFRYGRMWHVFINHGESDKMYMTTNQFKAYDYALVAGQAALDRLRRALWDYDFDKRAIQIGRPQADHFAGALPYQPDDRVTVLYAPTWEGDRPAAAYGSVRSHGVALVKALLATGRHRVIYRPHPRSGVLDREYKAANQQIIAMIREANARDSKAQHIYDDGPELGWQLAAADIAVTDISAMIYDRLATGKPVVVTRPDSPLAEIDEGGYLGDAEWLDGPDAGAAVPILERVLTSDESQERLKHWARHHFGDTSRGSATERFHTAVRHLLAEWVRHAALHAGDPKPTGSLQVDDADDGLPGSD
ncbi:CDP-glycerol glycerophosphotransferase family protein [Lysobacter korlensis]|uniref:CDP-glycerol glycerophosphotransferase family protein n=1 Tax=Lysobacter korlensis TaxID=553636 RepID=A0ABV6RPH0_9GAMM